MVVKPHKKCVIGYWSRLYSSSLPMAKIYSKAFFDSRIVPVEEAQLSVASSAILYGLSVYTVFPICITQSGKVAFRLSDHFRRMLDSARIIGIDTFEQKWT